MHSQLYTIYISFLYTNFLLILFFVHIFFCSHLISIFSVCSYRKKRELNCSAYSWRKSIIYVAIIYKWEVEWGGGFLLLYFGGRKTRRMWNEHNKKKSYNSQSRSSNSSSRSSMREKKVEIK